MTVKVLGKHKVKSKGKSEMIRVNSDDKHILRQSDLKHKLVFLHCGPDNEQKIAESWSENNRLNCLNIGFLSASYLSERLNSKYLSDEADEFLKKTINASARFSDDLARNALVIHNIGILFEPALRLSVSAIFRALSRNLFLFVAWPGNYDINTNRYFFIDEKSGILLDFRDSETFVIRETDTL